MAMAPQGQVPASVAKLLPEETVSLPELARTFAQNRHLFTNLDLKLISSLNDAFFETADDFAPEIPLECTAGKGVAEIRLACAAAVILKTIQEKVQMPVNRKVLRVIA